MNLYKIFVVYEVKADSQQEAVSVICVGNAFNQDKSIIDWDIIEIEDDES